MNDVDQSRFGGGLAIADTPPPFNWIRFLTVHPPFLNYKSELSRHMYSTDTINKK